MRTIRKLKVKRGVSQRSFPEGKAYGNASGKNQSEEGAQKPEEQKLAVFGFAFSLPEPSPPIEGRDHSPFQKVVQTQQGDQTIERPRPMGEPVEEGDYAHIKGIHE